MSGKKWLSFDEQVALLQKRGLIIDNKKECATFLSQVNYYRLSGYFRYWQNDPSNGDNQFIPGARFTTIINLYRAEENLKAACTPLLHSLEVLVRTRFAHYYGRRFGATGCFIDGEGFTEPPRKIKKRPESGRRKSIKELAKRDLDRSQEAFIAHYKKNNYAQMPIWVAVEVFSFGVLSRMIEASGESNVLSEIASSMSTTRRVLPQQLHSFVYLRNRISHGARLWNHNAAVMPPLQRAQVRRAKEIRDFDDKSIYKILLTMSIVANKTGLCEDWLDSTIAPILEASPLLATGITAPRKYGDMDHRLLTDAPSAM